MKRLPNIQILRACAALMIVVNHCGIETGRLAATFGHGPLFNDAPWGSGVPLFFAISGFIMVATSAQSFGSATGAADFMRRRIIRIVPLYWLVTTFAFAVLLVAPALMKKAPHGDYLYVAASYLFYPYMRLSGDVRPLATPGWTLNLEMMFYVVFTVALLFPRRVGLSVLVGVLGLLVAAQVSGILPGVALNFWGDPIVLGFLFGAAIGIAYLKGWRLPGGWALALTAVGFYVLFHAELPNLPEDDIFRRLAAAIPAATIVAAFALAPQIDDRRWFWWPALLIGDASYSLYLVHEFLLRAMHIVWAKVMVGMVPLWVFIPVGMAVAVSAAVTLYWLFEKPATRWLNAVSKPRRASSAVQPSQPWIERRHAPRVLPALQPAFTANPVPVFGRRQEG
jgi:exopolysaccharide production protein ExoZ